VQLKKIEASIEAGTRASKLMDVFRALKTGAVGGGTPVAAAPPQPHRLCDSSLPALTQGPAAADINGFASG
jgi:hypothetical protein